MTEQSIYQPLTAFTNLYREPAQGQYRVGIPLNANIAADTIAFHARGPRADQTALIHENPDQSIERYSFAELDELATRLANALAELGVKPGQPIGIHTAQSPQTAISHMALYKLGAVALTLSHLYGPDSIAHILHDTGAKVIITNSDYWCAMRSALPASLKLRHRIVYGEPVAGEIDFNDCLKHPANTFEPVVTQSNDPAILMYTSGSTGQPKGMLHAHRIIHANVPTYTLAYNLELNRPGAVFWTPTDWTWVGGILGTALLAWQHGQTVVSTNHRFSAERTLELMERHGITHSLMTPTALKRIAEITRPRARWQLKVRVICTGGESLPARVLKWIEDELNVACNDFYGLTECNHMIGCCKRLFPTVPGSMGRAYPGRSVAIIDETGSPKPTGTIGEIASWLPDDPSLFLGYWGEPGVPEKMRIGNWVRSGDLAYCDENGYYWYQGRNDDLIKSAGYRIGPSEVEDTLTAHPDVAEAVVVGKPDRSRGAVVMAYIRLATGVNQDEQTKIRLQQHVKKHLAVYKYPRVIEFVDSFPLTSSGKIRRRTLRERAAEMGVDK